ncbi:MAG: hypothetical protein ACFFF4_16890 [Candidatus Thorarchaeota archaeon]
MSKVESLNLQWLISAALAAAWGISLSLQQTIDQIVITMAGMATLLLFLYVFSNRAEEPRILWDRNRGVLGIIRCWDVEVCSLRLFASIPLGIDLSHSATRVLSAMTTRYQEESRGTLEFVVCRPLGNSGTRVGFMVSRRGVRLPDGLTRLGNLAEHLHEDVLLLESAMRAAYPHTPIVSANVQDIELIRRGGVELLAEA